ncbi:hypothetical protein ACVWZV_009333 [Bradyrhizobium sp. GM5.1]|uniref:hypothetical protein n=1 Tax=Bradyrhizobium sp. 156 TaxID=2782630 RepID=UPI001FF808FC|nr:hypothetical protein [Bradyrhizobium sp. 156]MCK1326419.1 hypothetical protein [Bradyrhizobium sp. 156]
MIDERSTGGSDLPPGVIFRNEDRPLPPAGLTDHRLVVIELRRALAKCQARLLQKDELIHRQELLKAESDHRLLNDRREDPCQSRHVMPISRMCE